MESTTIIYKIPIKLIAVGLVIVGVIIFSIYNTEPGSTTSPATPQPDFIPLPSMDFRRNMWLRVCIEGYPEIGFVQIGFRDWVDGEPQPPRDQVLCSPLNGAFYLPSELEFLFHRAENGEYWMILSPMLDLKFKAAEKIHDFPEVDLHFRIPETVFNAIKKEVIHEVEILIKDNTTEVTYLWEGDLDEVIDRCKFFRGVSGRPTQDIININGTKIEAISVQVNNAFTGQKLEYYLINESHELGIHENVSYGKYCSKSPVQILSSEKVYLSGDAFDMRLNETGEILRFVQPMAVWLDKQPTQIEQATQIVINQVGEDYFKRYFSEPRIGFNKFEPEEWFSIVQIDYYFYEEGIDVYETLDFYFNEENYLLGYSGVPSSERLMPFKIKKEQAISIALNSANRTNRFGVDTHIYFCDRISRKLDLETYVWVVDIYIKKPTMWEASYIRVLIDPHSGEVLETRQSGWVAVS